MGPQDTPHPGALMVILIWSKTPERKALGPVEGSVSRVTAAQLPLRPMLSRSDPPCRAPMGRAELRTHGRLGGGAGRIVGAHPLCAAREFHSQAGSGPDEDRLCYDSGG